MTMPRYIDAEVFADRMLKTWDTADEQKRLEIVAVIANIVTPILVGTPTADVVEVKHGRWVRRAKYDEVYCSECRTLERYTDGNFKSRYCPNCGAKMDGKE